MIFGFDIQGLLAMIHTTHFGVSLEVHEVRAVIVVTIHNDLLAECT